MNHSCPICDASIDGSESRVAVSKIGLTLPLFVCSPACRTDYHGHNQDQDQENTS